MRPAILVLFIGLAACAPRGSILMDPAARTMGTPVDILVGTTRAVDPATGDFGWQRSETLSYARYVVSVPPDRQVGEIDWPRASAPDPQRDFLTVERESYPTAAQFRRALKSDRSTRPSLPGETGQAVIYIHGFNNNFAEGLYRFAQIAQDLKLSGSLIHYSWPSRASPLGYAYDIDSTDFGRDGLETLIGDVRAAGVVRPVIVAHSRGAYLLMETLRQMAIRGDRAGIDALGGIILIAPDIDVDVFRMQARAIGQLPRPFIVFASPSDPALGLSARVAGQPTRLGNVQDLTRLTEFKVTIIDVGSLRDGQAHFEVATSPTFIRLVNSLPQVDREFAQGTTRPRSILGSAAVSLQNLTAVVLSPTAMLSNPN